MTQITSVQNAPLPVYHCLRCGWTWHPRSDKKPVQCANKKCHSPYWDREVTRPSVAKKKEKPQRHDLPPATSSEKQNIPETKNRDDFNDTQYEPFGE